VIESSNLLGTRPEPRLKTGTPALDALLSPGFPADKGDPATTTGGILPGVVHVLAGPTWLLARVLMHIAISCQLPADKGGLGCERVIYGLFDNATDPHDMASESRALGMDPAMALDRVVLARGFNWDQTVEIVAKKVPEQAAPGTVVLLSGLTSQMDAADPRSFEGLQEMIGGIKRCLERPPTWVVATSPVAQGSVFKPVGGNNLLHFAGCIVAVTRRQQSATTTIVEYRLVKHPLAPERVTKEFFVKKPARKRKRKGELSAFRTLEDFL